MRHTDYVHPARSLADGGADQRVPTRSRYRALPGTCKIGASHWPTPLPAYPVNLFNIRHWLLATLLTPNPDRPANRHIHVRRHVVRGQLHTPPPLLLSPPGAAIAVIPTPPLLVAPRPLPCTVARLRHQHGSLDCG